MRVMHSIGRIAIVGALIVGVQTATVPAASAEGPAPTPSTSAAPAPDPSEQPTPTAEQSDSPTPTESARPSLPQDDATKAREVLAAPLAASALTCATGYSYSISSDGTLQQVVAGGSPVLSTIGQWSGVSDANGLGIGAGGTVAYAYERTSDSYNIRKILMYTSGGGFQAIANSSYTLPDWGAGSVVAGAVNLSNGHFVFGAFGTRGSTSVFFLYDYNPSTNVFTKNGWFRTNAGQGNGDMAFDASGNLYVVSSSGSTTLYSVTAADFSAAAGDNEIVRSATNSVSLSGFAGVNGIAFDTDGTIFLGNDSEVRRYNPTTFTQVGGTITTGLGGNSTDLGSCNSPVSLTVRKNVVGRVGAGDQFTLNVAYSGTPVSSVTTTGTATGVQANQIGPLPVIAGYTYVISETASGTANLSNYASAYTCTYGGQTLATGAGVSGAVTMPTSPGATVDCVFTNAPLTASVTINKQMQDLSGQNATNRQGWTVGATATATTGTATVSPAGTQTTGADGNARWGITFGTEASRATVSVRETLQPNYSFVSGSCVISPLTGAPTTVQLTGPGAQNLTGIKPGDNVQCTYTNKPDAARLTLVKQVQNTYGGTLQPNSWTLTAAGGSPATTVTGVTGTPAVTSVVVPIGGYALSETSTAAAAAGYAAGNWSCTGATVTGSTVTLVKDANATCTIVNSDKPGAVTWSKTNASNALLAGSEWTLTGPAGAGSQNVVVGDCIAASAAGCAGPDQNPAAGQFLLQNLTWGSYTLTETKAPPGYQISGTPFTFSVTAQNAGTVQALGARTNPQQPGVAIPFTGGLSTDGYLIAGGGILAITVLAGTAAWSWRRARRSAG